MKNIDNNQLLKSIPALINKTFPVPARFRSKLPHDIAELSRLLTSSRTERSLSYLNKPNLLSAYLHYFLPWNLYRLTSLLPSLGIALSRGDSVIDFGSGTLAFVSALWITRSDLRTVPLEFFCIDRSGQALEAGKKFFEALSGESPWNIKLLREDINIHSRSRTVGSDAKMQRNAKLITAVNVFNEIYENIPHNNINKLKQFAANAAQFMHAQAADRAQILTVEPGIPQSGRFISFLREAFLKMDYASVSPCTHSAACPLIVSGNTKSGNSSNKKWCHFAIENLNPPKELVNLSAAAKLPKERLVYSYLLMENNRKERKEDSIRIISDAFPLPGNKYGHYGCCGQGLVLLCGSKDRIEKIVSGSLVTNYISTNKLDEKSGAIIIKYNEH